MPEYRLYTINDLGHVRGRFVLHCRNEADALAMVERRRGSGEMELWENDRLVRSFPALAGEPVAQPLDDDRRSPPAREASRASPASAYS